MKISRSGLLAVLTLTFASPLIAQEPRLVNVSTLTRVGTSGDVLIAGFGISGTTPKQVVIRAVGPRLAATPFNVLGTLGNPLLTVFDRNNVVVARNDDWLAADAAAFASVGAFALNANSQDAALVATLAPGTYSAQVSGVGGTTGTAIVEVYEVGLSGGKFTNLSTRAQVGGAAGTLTTGFVVSPGGRDLLGADNWTVGRQGDLFEAEVQLEVVKPWNVGRHAFSS